MSDFLHRQAKKERKEREYYTRLLGIRRAAPYHRESPRRSTPTDQVQATEQTLNLIDLTFPTLGEGEAGAPRGSDAPQAQTEPSETLTIGRSSLPKRRREDDDDDDTFN